MLGSRRRQVWAGEEINTWKKKPLKKEKKKVMERFIYMINMCIPPMRSKMSVLIFDIKIRSSVKFIYCRKEI